MKKKNFPIRLAILAAALYGLNIPISKILLERIQPVMMAAFLYLGAGIGLFLYGQVEKLFPGEKTVQSLTKKELPYTIAMVVLDILAPILLMVGISLTTSANVSLLNNFEIVTTSLIALFIFQEAISNKLWMAILWITIASIILGFEGRQSFVLNKGSLFVMAATVCWGFENNCTRMLSSKSTVEIVTIKGVFSGGGSLLTALIIGEGMPPLPDLVKILFLGFLTYGLSIHFYILAQKDLGAAKTSSFYSMAPFLGVVFSMIFLRETPGIQFFIALIMMVISTVLMVQDNIHLQHDHQHIHIHNHLHSHGNLKHIHSHKHKHSHLHIHGEGMEDHSHELNTFRDHGHSHG